MPTTNIKVGPFTALYIGDYGASSVLQQIPDLTTGTQTITEDVPEEFFVAVDNSLQVGRHRAEVTLTFYGDSDLLVKVARGLSVDATNKDDPSTFTQYVLLAISGEDEDKSSFLFPKCRTTKRLSLNYSKTEVTSISITFIAEDRDRFNDILYINTPDALASILGARSPI